MLSSTECLPLYLFTINFFTIELFQHTPVHLSKSLIVCISGQKSIMILECNDRLQPDILPKIDSIN